MLDAATAPTTRPTSTVMRNRRNILNSTDAESMSSQHSDCCLSTWTWGACPVASGRSNTNMERRDSLVLRNLRGSSSRLHRCIWGPLQSVSLYMLTPCAARDRLSTSQICNVNHSVVEARIDVSNSPVIRWLLSLLRHDLDYPRSLRGRPANLNP
jgi:hypothetical protein